MIELTVLERAVLQALLGGDHPALEALRGQLHGLRVTRRVATPTSFSTLLRTAPTSPPAPVPGGRAVLDDVHADVPSLPGGAGFALFVEEGRMVRLEGSTFGGERWPDDLAGFTVHLDDPERDLSDLDAPG